MELNTESDIQFLARMILMTHENNQIMRADSRRLANMAQFGPGPVPAAMPEERSEANKLPPLSVENQA